MLGDIVGEGGSRAVAAGVPRLRDQLQTDLVVANVENAAAGFGLTPKQLDELRVAGVQVMTSGNHIWQHKQIIPYLDSEVNLLRPENYPIAAPGHGWCECALSGARVVVLNLEGRKSLSPLRCPFETAKDLLGRLDPRPDGVIIDFHAEASDEKEALAAYLDGEVSAVIGTHTHVQTADERVLPGGTAYLTDAGMCGPEGSVLGMNSEVSVRRFATQLPLKMEVQQTPVTLHGVILEIDTATGHAKHVERFRSTDPV